MEQNETPTSITPFNPKLNRLACQKLSKKRFEMSEDEKALMDWDGNPEKLDILLARGVPIDIHTPSSNRSPLIKAVNANEPQRVKALLERGANPNFESQCNITPLLQLTSGRIITQDILDKKRDILRQLLKQGAQLHGGLLSGFSCSRNRAVIRSMMVEEGVAFTYEDFQLVFRDRDLTTCRAMAHRGFVIEHNVFKNQQSPAQDAVFSKETKLLALLIETGHKPWLDRPAMKRLVSIDWKDGIEIMLELAKESQEEIEDAIKQARTVLSISGRQPNLKKPTQIMTGAPPTLAMVQARLINTITSRTSPPISGSVYVMTNPCMPGLVKIGYTRRGATKRAEDLSRDLEITAVPGRFSVELEIPTDEPELLENTFHILFCRKRAERGEFFYVSVEDVATVARLAGFIK